MLKVWGRNNSSNVRKVLWCVEELAVPYSRIEAGGAFGVVDSPEYRALNPNGRVPMIEDDGFVLWESNAIVRYLAAQYGSDTSFYPADAKVRAQADKWMDWTTASFAGPFRDVFWGDEIGMGDIPLGSFMYAWFEMPIERPPAPHLSAWYERLKLRPAYRNGVMTALT